MSVENHIKNYFLWYISEGSQTEKILFFYI